MTQTSISRRVSVLILCTISLCTFWFLGNDEYTRFSDPTGKYTAVVTRPRYLRYIPVFPGQGGDKEGHVTIIDTAGTRYGRIPIPMVSMASELNWIKDGATIKLVGDWNFRNKTYRYWNKSQTKEIVKHVR